jgi:hypothetical protein
MSVVDGKQIVAFNLKMGKDNGGKDRPMVVDSIYKHLSTTENGKPRYRLSGTDKQTGDKMSLMCNEKSAESASKELNIKITTVAPKEKAEPKLKKGTKKAPAKNGKKAAKKVESSAEESESEEEVPKKKAAAKKTTTKAAPVKKAAPAKKAPAKKAVKKESSEEEEETSEEEEIFEEESQDESSEEEVVVVKKPAKKAAVKTPAKKTTKGKK